MYCLKCKTAGSIDQVFHIEFHPTVGSGGDGDDDDDDDNDDNNDDDDHLSRRSDDDGEDPSQIFKNHVKRTYVTYTVTEEIRLRKQFQIKTSEGVDVYCSLPVPGLALYPGDMGCGKYFTGGGLSWEPGAAQEDKAGRDNAEGPKKVTDPKAGKGVSNVSYSVSL